MTPPNPPNARTLRTLDPPAWARPAQWCPSISAAVGASVWVKCETGGPTGSHKDRESALVIEWARAAGAGGVGCASSGNYGISLAWYARDAHMPCHVWLPPSGAHAAVVGALRDLDAQVHVIDTDLGHLYPRSSEEMARAGIFDGNPGVCEAKVVANAAIGREISLEVDGLSAVACCVNNGTHLIGVASGLTHPATRVFGAYTHSRHATSLTGFHHAEGADRIAAVVDARGGALVEVDDEDLRWAARLLQAAGIEAECSSASALAVLRRAPRQERVCCVITSRGARKAADLRNLFAGAGGAV